MKFLKDRLLEDKKITVLLDEVAEGELQLTALSLLSLHYYKPFCLNVIYLMVNVLNYFKLFLVAFC